MVGLFIIVLIINYFFIREIINYYKNKDLRERPKIIPNKQGNGFIVKVGVNKFYTHYNSTIYTHTIYASDFVETYEEALGVMCNYLRNRQKEKFSL